LNRVGVGIVGHAIEAIAVAAHPDGAVFACRRPDLVEDAALLVVEL
jgi:hypothetical protein